MIISLETAKLAKELGFNLNSPAYYGCDEPVSGESNRFMTKSWIKYEDLGSEDPQEGTLIYSAPTQEQLQKWLREVHKINVESNYLPNIEKYGTLYIPMNIKPNTFKDVKEYREHRNKYVSNLRFDTYEEALEHGLKQSLKLL